MKPFQANLKMEKLGGGFPQQYVKSFHPNIGRTSPERLSGISPRSYRQFWLHPVAGLFGTGWPAGWLSCASWAAPVRSTQTRTVFGAGTSALETMTFPSVITASAKNVFSYDGTR
jgi:hypothetical protein